MLRSAFRACALVFLVHWLSADAISDAVRFVFSSLCIVKMFKTITDPADTDYWPHTAGNTQTMIRQFGWEQFEHPPYTPDLEPSECHLFLHLKHELGGKCFGSDEEVKNAVQSLVVSFTRKA